MIEIEQRLKTHTYMQREVKKQKKRFKAYENRVTKKLAIIQL